jgi:uncharacterized protein with PIN domain
MVLDTSAIIAAISNEPDGMTFQTAMREAGYQAQLNIVDCVVYALAKRRNESLLFKGDDFARTDITPAH